MPNDNVSISLVSVVARHSHVLPLDSPFLPNNRHDHNDEVNINVTAAYLKNKYVNVDLALDRIDGKNCSCAFLQKLFSLSR